MLNFRKTNILSLALLLLLIWGNSMGYHVSIWAYIGLVLVYSLVLFYGCYYIGSNFFITVICSAKTTEKVIAISFDDGPDAAGTPQILQILKANDVPAAFFCIGNKIAGNEAIVRQIHAQGHIIGNHSFSHHFWFDMFSSKKMLDDMQQTDSALKNAIDVRPLLFRPPYGVINPNLKKAIINGGYTTVGWSVRSMDTVIKDETQLLNKVLNKLNPGAVFLFHDTSAVTIVMLPAFIEQVRAQGYNIARLDKMLNLQAYA
jgi:peptidoglycan/xylan/chitin deacetylase (PgdA/CDA1 family)